MRFLLHNEACVKACKQGAKLIHQYPSFSLLSGNPSLPKKNIQPLQIIDSEDIYVNGHAFNIPEGNYIIDNGPRSLIRFIGPVARQWHEQLINKGVSIRFWCPPFGACVQFPSQIDAKKLKKQLPFIAGAQPYKEPQCTRRLRKSPPGVPASLVDIVCFSREERVTVEALLKKRRIPVVASSSSKIRIKYNGDLKKLRQMKGVKLVDYTRTNILTGKALNDSLGLSTVNSSPGTALTGEGQIVAVADTGLDKGVNNDCLHPDFKGNTRAIVSLPINQSWDSFVKEPGHDDGPSDKNSGHGTHVAGLAVGNGSKSNKKHYGVAPKAQLVFQAIEQYTQIKSDRQNQLKSGYYLNGRPLDLRELFQQAYEYGARIHVNSWGDPVSGAYTDDCYEADDFLHKHPDSVILFAAGNEGADINGDRVLDEHSLYAPASAKNVIAIGATEGPRAGIGLRDNWAVFDSSAKRFRHSSDRSDLISGEPDRIALFSSAGPSVDGRIKPDICIPGTNLAAPRSQIIAGRAWGLASPLPYYMYWGGTSSATGVAGGCMALLREAWQKKFSGHAPSGQALKALTVLGTRPVLRRADNKSEPAYVAGFGRLYFDDALPGSSTYEIELVDETDPGLLTGEMREYTVELKKNSTFRAVLAWYDASGERLINDLDLRLISPDGKTVFGNHSINGNDSIDRINTIESIDIDSIPPGKYTLRVIAYNVPVAPQTFGLAVRTNRGSRKTSATIEITEGNTLSCSISLPVSYLQGFGKRSEQLLNGKGIKNIGKLIETDTAKIKNILKRVTRLTLARIEILTQLLNISLPTELDPDLTLPDLLDETGPGSLSVQQWQSIRRTFLPLLFIFDQKKWDSISLSDLWTV